MALERLAGGSELQMVVGEVDWLRRRDLRTGRLQEHLSGADSGEGSVAQCAAENY